MARTTSFILTEEENSRVEALMALFGFKSMSAFFLEGMDILSDWEEFSRHGYNQPCMLNPKTGEVIPMEVKYLQDIDRRIDDLIIPFRCNY